MHTGLSSSLSSFQAFRVQLSYCRLNIGYISAYLTPDRSTVGETRKYQTRSAFLDSLSSAQRYIKVAFSHDWNEQPCHFSSGKNNVSADRAWIVEHIQVEVRSANNSICMYVFYFYLFQTYYFGLTDKSTEFPLLFNSWRMYGVKKKMKLRNLFTAQLCRISQLKPRFLGYSGEFLHLPSVKR